MKIELEKKRNLTFGDVKAGEVFITMGGNIAFKIERGRSLTQANAVFLDDGSWTNFGNDELISHIVKNAVLREENER